MTGDKRPLTGRAELRRKAEELSQENRARSRENIKDLSPEETEHVIHELCVHQIELEMQNEELLRLQTELQASHERFQDLYDFAPVGYCTASEQGLILEINLTAATLLGVPRSQLIGNPLSRFILAEDQGIYFRHRKALCIAGEPEECEVRIVRADKSLFWARFEGIEVKDASGAATYRFALVDITAHKLTEENAIASQVYLDKIINNIGDPLFVKDEQQRMILVNDAFCSISGLSRSEIIGKTLADDLPLDQAEYFTTIDRQMLTDGQENVSEGLLTVNGGKTLTVSTRKTRYVDENGDIFLIGVIRDISQRKRSEEKIKQNLLEKETLLREIHHRVKNNMAVISSLLSLQASGIKDESMKELFNASRQRIKAMALVHEKLYGTENLTLINFHDYITTIAGELFSAYRQGERSIVSKINAPDIFFDIDTALPCGLIINELITNTLKHGFTEKLSGELCIDFKKVNTTYSLTVSDNGIGLPEGFAPAKAESMGMQLVTVLVRQLRGTLDFQANAANGKGTKIIITFEEKAGNNHYDSR